LIELVNEKKTIICRGKEEVVVPCHGSGSNATITTIVILYQHSLIEVTIHDEFYSTSLVPNGNHFSIRFDAVLHIGNKKIWLNWDSFQWSNFINATNVDKAVKLTLRTDDKLLFAIGSRVWHDCPDRFWFPILFWLFIFWRKLTSQTHSSLLFFFSFIFLLIFFAFKTP